MDGVSADDRDDDVTTDLDHGTAPGVDRMYLAPRQLGALTRFYADEVARGSYPFVDFDPDDRWHRRIYRDRRVDVWLISWLPTQGTQLHDHGGSAGSFTVLSGELTEAVLRGSQCPELVDHVRVGGDSVGFGRRYVHDVRNLSDQPAVSVHAYSPPLTTMTFYDLDDGALRPLVSLATDDPEPDAGELAREPIREAS